MVNNTKEAEVALAVANLAAVAMAANPKLTMAAAVAQARATLLGTKATDSQIAKSVRPDKILCLEDNTWHIMLRRYIKRKYNLTPEQYREKWGLPHDYPFVAPDYARTRSKIAKKSGFGKKK